MRPPSRSSDATFRLVRGVFTPVCLLAAWSCGAVSTLAAQSGTDEWADFDLVQFIAVAGSGPASVLALDDNGHLALMAENGAPETELLARTGARASQVALLEAWRLVERNGDTVGTTFPILDEAETRRLRSLTRALAPRLAESVAPEVVDLHDELSATGRAANAYSILFSYVLDGLTWTIWEQDGIIEERTLTAEYPFWSGEIWAVRPERPAMVGTNRISDERGTLYMSWSHDAVRSMGPFIAEFGKVVTLFERFADRRPVEPELRAVFERYNILDDGGFPTFPIIEPGAEDQVHEISVAIATKIVRLVPGALDVPILREQFGFRSDSQALVIAYHELMWDILAELVATGVVSRPPVLNGDARTPADVAALIFGVR